MTLVVHHDAVEGWFEVDSLHDAAEKMADLWIEYGPTERIYTAHRNSDGTMRPISRTERVMIELSVRALAFRRGMFG